MAAKHVYPVCIMHWCKKYKFNNIVPLVGDFSSPWLTLNKETQGQIAH